MNNLIKDLEKLPCSVYLQKFSQGTYIQDCKELKQFLEENSLEATSTPARKKPIWRCKIGLKGKWHYSQSFKMAIHKAINEHTEENVFK